MAKEPLIDPVEYHGPGACPICFTPLVLADRETNIMDLDKHGYVVNISDSIVKCSAICPKCGHTQEMMRSNGIYRPYSKVVQIFDELDLMDKIDRRKNEGKYDIKENPLSLDD